MCGITGYFDLRGQQRTDSTTLMEMTDQLRHRGPDAAGHIRLDNVGFGFRRLAIVDLAADTQPVSNEDNRIITICNGEFYNYEELRNDLLSKGHHLKSKCDTDLLPHLYEEYGMDLLAKIDGQFAMAIYDSRTATLHLARDQFGINPLFYYFKDGLFIFGSEIKAILAHPCVERAVNLRGLDQIFSFPGLVSPETMFAGINSLSSGHRLVVSGDGVREFEFWDLVYPMLCDAAPERAENYYVERLHDLLIQSVQLRRRSDVPVGLYLSGGLDSSLVGAMVHSLGPSRPQSFSISFAEREMSERAYQEQMSACISGHHEDICFTAAQVFERLEAAVSHSECPMKDTYNTACYALSEVAYKTGVCVALTGQGADELFAGYIGYKFDGMKVKNAATDNQAEVDMRQQLWADSSIVYEGNYAATQKTKLQLYSELLRDHFDKFDSYRALNIKTDRLRGRHPVHQRSYLDLKLRLADHLLGDHGDRMAMANSVELRHPFLCTQIADFCAEVPPTLKIRNFEEKYVVKQVARRYLPPRIVDREKFGWFAPSSAALLSLHSKRIADLLSPERIRREGYFDPQAIASLKQQYSRPDFKLNQPFEPDLLFIVITFGIFLETFSMPSLG
jgi:asparagine synthase (glutamine-hydrolysing)